MLTWIGWLGGLLLAVCAVPQAIQSYRDGHSDGITWSLLWLWGMGEVLTFIYVGVTDWRWPLITNYICNIAAILIIGWYKIKGK